MSAPTQDGGHLDLDAIAELDEGVTDAAVKQEREAHLAGCAMCREQQARLRTTRALLSTLPAEPMPDDVAKRIDEALSASSGTIVPAALPRKRVWSRHPSLAGVAAAVAILGLVTAVAVGALHGGGSNGSGGGATLGPNAAGGVAGAPVRSVTFVTSGKVYTRQNANGLIDSLARKTTSQPAAVSGTPTPSAQSQATSPKPNAVPLALRAMYSNPAALLPCISALAGFPNATPLAIDFAKWTDPSRKLRKVPALVVLLPHAIASHDAAYIVGPHCATAPDNNIYYYHQID